MASYDGERQGGAGVTIVIVMLLLFTLNVNFHKNIFMFHDINQTSDFFFLTKNYDKVSIHLAYLHIILIDNT